MTNGRRLPRRAPAPGGARPDDLARGADRGGPALARLRDPAILLELARALPRFHGAADEARPVLLRELKAATGLDVGEDHAAWVRRLEALPRR